MVNKDFVVNLKNIITNVMEENSSMLIAVLIPNVLLKLKKIPGLTNTSLMKIDILNAFFVSIK